MSVHFAAADNKPRKAATAAGDNSSTQQAADGNAAGAPIVPFEMTFNDALPLQVSGTTSVVCSGLT
jgi:hypothetical protein